MPTLNAKLTTAGEDYRTDLRRIRASGGATGERSYYPALSDGVQLPREDSRIVPAFLACKAFTQRNGNRAGHGLAGQTRQLTG